MRLVFLTGLVAWTVAGSSSHSSNDVHSVDHALAAVVRSSNYFHMRLFEKVFPNHSGNLIISSISTSLVLSMATFGASGRTAQRLHEVLEFPADDSFTLSGLSRLVNNLELNSRVKLHVATKMFLRAGMVPKKNFLAVTEQSFKSPVQSVNFHDPIEASNIISTWSATQTNNRITNIVAPGDLTESTSLVLVNAIYFQGKWKTKFNEQLTKLRPFYINGVSEKNIMTMERDGNFIYGELPEVDAKFIRLPYESDDENGVSMFILLPNKFDGLALMEKNVARIGVNTLINRGSLQKVLVNLPKFKIESKISLNKPLCSMGLTNMFTPGTANFQNIVDSPPLYVSEVVQKAFIEVSETGTEAAASTVIGLMGVLASIPADIQFLANRPFISIIATTNPRNRVVVLAARYTGAEQILQIMK